MLSTLYCVVAYIAACVDASRTVFWDRSVTLRTGEARGTDADKTANQFRAARSVLTRQTVALHRLRPTKHACNDNRVFPILYWINDRTC